MTGDRDKDKKTGKAGGLDKADLTLWRLFTHDIKPIHEIDWTTLEKEAELLNNQKAIITETVLVPPPARSAPRSAQMDRRTEERLRRGKMPIDARLDLHGYTQEKAYDALQNFIQGSQRRGCRCVLVITGKGKSHISPQDEWRFNDGVLRQRLPQWLSTPPLSEIALRYFPAQPKDGGEGAYYVYLRRLRDYSP